ncbi:MAG: Gldg family protein [Brevinema sp.]
MKKSYIIISIPAILCLFSLISYILWGEKSIAFRSTLLVLTMSMVGLGIFYRRKFTDYFKKGKVARGKLLEAIALLVFFVTLLITLKSFNLNVDWTSQGLFRLSSETKNILKTVPSDKPITITLFYYLDPSDSVGAVAEYGKKLASRYESATPLISFREVDPLRDKIIADEYGVRENGTFVFEMDGRREYIAPTLLVETFQEGEILYKGETIFSAAIDKLVNNQETKIYFLTGNGELDWQSGGARGYDGIYGALQDRRYTMEALNLDHNPSVPDDANLLVVADPQSPLTETTVNSIERYIDEGGAILFLLGQRTTEDINILLIRGGFVYLNNVALDMSRVAKNSGEFSIIPDLSPRSDITRLLRRRNLGVIFPSSSAFSTIPPDRSDTNFLYDIAPLARSSAQGFGETSFRTGQYQKDDDDIHGPLILAASSIIAPKASPEAQTRFLVFGSTEFIDNNSRFLGGNMNFFLNGIDFLLQKDLKTSVAPKTENLTLSVADPLQLRTMFVITSIWMLLWICAGMIVLLMRRNMVKKTSK